jgi:crotonobetainyl-CoA:carnitine CoA-transferase CaiB-like acyl-CoA transferase
MKTVRPLEGVRILDLTRLLPGAYATLLLADLGADVIKIEDPRGGDGMRHLPTAGRRDYFALLNRNKRSVTLDLRSRHAPDVLDKLLAKADVIIDSFRPSTARRLGVAPETLRANHPHLVCASITGFGPDGPSVERAAHDINYQALAGTLTPPQMPGPLIADISSAMHAALGIVAALVQRNRTGAGSVVSVSIHEAALAWTMFPSTANLANACYQLYETADGQWLALGALEEKFWTGFCERIERPDLAPLQHAHGDERARVLAEVRDTIRRRTRDEWLARFAGADVCLTPVNDLDAALSDPHAQARGVVVFDDREVYIAPPDAAVRAAPALGAHTDAVLEEAGIDAVTRARLRNDKVL